MIVLDIDIEIGSWSEVPALEDLAQRAAQAALASVPGADAGPVAATLLLTGDREVAELNRQWRGQDRPTNVLSFPASLPAIPGEPRQLGDIALAYETVAREAADESKTVADHAAHLIVHGVLHLLGQDHATDGEADTMERIEVAALSSLGIANPYRDAPA